jgi:hypothetical protein
VGEKRNAYGVLVGKPEGKRPVGRPIYRCKYHIKMDITEISWVGMDWNNLAQDREQWNLL